MLGQLLQLSIFEITLLGTFLYTSIYLSRRLLRSNIYLNTLPWVGLRKERFSMIRGSLRQLLGSVETLDEGYKKFSLDGKAFVMSDPTFQPQVMLPQEHIKWFMEQPEAFVSHWSARQERHALEYLQIGVDFADTTTFLTNIISYSLSPNRLGEIQVSLLDEIKQSVSHEFGEDSGNFKDYNVQEVVSRLISSIGSRVLFGFPLCSNKRFLHAVDKFILYMGIGTIVIGQLPPILIRPFFGSLLRLPVMYYKRQVAQELAPVIRERITHLKETGDDPMLKESSDFLTQSVKRAIERRTDGEDGVTKHLLEQFCLLAFAAISPAGLGGTNLLLDIISADPKYNLYESLRQEAISVLPSPKDWEDPLKVRKLVLMDSSIRESLRTNPTLVRGLLRGAVHKDGLDLPDGSHIPTGSWIGTPVLNIHNDERFYENPDTFDPWRFVIRNNVEEIGSNKAPNGKLKIESGQVNDTFLSFGGGKHACPGRWYVVHMFKILLAHIVVNYEIESLPQRPKRRVVGDANVPNISTIIRVKRRSDI